MLICAAAGCGSGYEREEEFEDELKEVDTEHGNFNLYHQW